jgi:hypothetical protein
VSDSVASFGYSFAHSDSEFGNCKTEFKQNRSRVGPVSLLMSPSQTMEQHAGEKSEVYPGSPVTEPMQILFRSNWSPLIAPYRSVLIDFDSGTLRASFSATNRNVWTDGPGSTVACVRPHDAARRYREFAANDLGNKQQRPSAFGYGDGQLPGKRPRNSNTSWAGKAFAFRCREARIAN